MENFISNTDGYKMKECDVELIFIADRLSGCFRAESEQYWAELRSVVCSVCVQSTLMSPVLSASPKTCLLWHKLPACEEVHTYPRSLSLRPNKTSPRPRCNTAGGPRCHPEKHTNSSQQSAVLLKPVACSEFKNVPEALPDRHQPPHSPVPHRSYSQWWCRCTRWSGYMFSCQWALPQLPAICSSACLEHINQNKILLIRAFKLSPITS